MKIKQLKERAQSGFLATKTALIVGSIMAASTVATLTGASALSAEAASEVGSPGSSDFCVTSAWVDNPDIKTVKGSCMTDETGEVITPPVEDVDIDPVVMTQTCDLMSIEVTSSMKQHSDSNITLKEDGKEMIPYPNGGWNIIYDISTQGPSYSGIAFTDDGEFSTEITTNLTNTEGVAFIYSNDKSCVGVKLHNNEIHSVDGPAYVISDVKGSKTHMYVINGEPYRDNGKPAVEGYHSNGRVNHLTYYENGVVHRADKPAAIFYYEDGSLQSESWFKEGVNHRTDGPAVESFHENGDNLLKEWFVNGERHRIDGPAQINYDNAGRVSGERWYQNGVSHRLDGPAIITYRSEDPNVISQSYHYIEGVGYRSIDDREAWIAAGGNPDGWPL